MQRLTLAVVVTVVLLAVSLAVGSPYTDDEKAITAGDSQVTVLGRTATTDRPRRDSTTTTEPRRDTTTTSGATTSTTRPPATSTTTTPRSSSTTTTPTTTAPPPGVVAEAIPTTLPYAGGLDLYGGYDAILSCGASTADFDCDQFGSNHWWDAPYLGTNLPYTAGYAWVDGDRQGYSCAYGFLQDLSTGELIGRWAALLPPEAEAYGKINDRFMAEGVRYYDGELANEGGNELKAPDKASECTDLLSDDIDYSAVNTGPDERPRIGFFNGAGQVIDIRDYSNTALSSPGKFKLLAFDGTEAVVAFYPAQNNKAAVTFYYTAMGSGQLVVDFDGAGPYQP